MSQENLKRGPNDIVPKDAVRRIYSDPHAIGMTFEDLNDNLAHCRDTNQALAHIREGADPCYRNSGKTSPHRAGKGSLHGCRNADVARLLIEHGANPSLADDQGVTPLHEAYSADTMRVLIDAGADVLARDHEGRTPLDVLREDVARRSSSRSDKGLEQLVASLEAETSRAELQRELSSWAQHAPNSEFASTGRDNQQEEPQRRTRRM